MSPLSLANILAASPTEADLAQLTDDTLRPLPPDQQYSVIVDLFTEAILYRQHLIDGVTVCWDYFLANSLWQTKFSTFSDFEKSFPYYHQLGRILDEGARTHTRTLRFLDTITQAWGDYNHALPDDIKPSRFSYHLSLHLSELASQIPLQQALILLRKAIQERCSNPRRRGKHLTCITRKDVQAVLALLPVPAQPNGTLADLPALPPAPQRPLLLPAPAHTPVPRHSSPQCPTQRTRRSNTRCHCTQEIIDKLQRLQTSSPLSVRLEAFHFGVAQHLTSFCWDHIRSYFSKSVALLSNSARGRAVLEERIMKLHSHLQAGGDYSAFVASRHKEQWFNATVRAVTHIDAWRPFRYPPALQQEPEIDPSEIFYRFTGDRDSYNSFLQTGNIILPNFFRYLNTDEIKAHVDTEFHIYRYHFRPNIGTPSMGFLRNCFYALIQQAFRMDPGYYLINVAARPNHQWRLISYPYVAKETTPGERTLFMHLDISLDKYFSDDKIGFDQLTSSVSIDNEDDKNCTYLVPAFMAHAKEWLDRVKGRLQLETISGHRTDALKNYTKEDAQLFGTPQPFPCPAFGIRVTLPTVIHGSSAHATITRRVIYPWFTAIQPDHETLEIPGQHTWSELAALHRDLKAPEQGVAGERVSQDRPPDRFAGAIKLDSVSPLSDALVGRRRWTDPEVLCERDVLFGRDSTAAIALLNQIRSRLYDALSRAYKKMEAIERYAFRELSYYHNSGIQPPTPEPIGSESEEMEVE